MNAQRIDRKRRRFLAVLAAAAAGVGAATWTTRGGSAQADEPAPDRTARDDRLAPYSTRSAVRRANEETFADVVLDSDLPVLVDFYAAWCGPCRAMAPALEEFARETPRVRVVKVDVDESPKLAARYSVRSLPSLVIFRDGRPVVKHTGASDKRRLAAMFDLYADSPTR